jgi:hypothetical protein
MNTAPWSFYGAAAGWGEALQRLGFTPAASAYRRGEFRLETGPDWWMLSAPCEQNGPDATGNVGQPGLWKPVGRPGGLDKVFGIPLRGFPAEDTLDLETGEPGVMEQTLAWALATAGALPPPAWKAPDLATVQTWFPRDRLTVVAGGLVQQGELICDADRLALRFPNLARLPDDLPPSRLAWLETLFEGARNRWQLVRVGCLADDAGTAAVAEVDLTGAPPAILETLFAHSLDALRWTVQWLGESADWLADVTVASELLAVCPNHKP